MVELKSAGEIAAMREAGRAVAAVLAAVQASAAAGVTLRSLDALARSVLAEHGATSTFLGYQPRFAPTAFPAVICSSVNDAALHGIPDGYRLRDGDLLSIDCGAEIGGWAADAAVTFVVGTPRPADVRLADTTRRALRRPARGSATSRMPSARSAAAAGTGSTPTSAATESAGACTRSRRCRTRDGRNGA